MLMVNYSKNWQDESSQASHCKPNRRRLKLEDVMRYRRDSRKARKVGKRGRREN